MNDILFAAKLDRLDICMRYLRNELRINLVDAGNGSIGLEWANRWWRRSSAVRYWLHSFSPIYRALVRQSIIIYWGVSLQKLDSLQYIRALAALAVVVFHLNVYYKATSGNDLPYAEWGFLGVDVFFVLSGFIVSHSTKTMDGLKFSISFLARRAGRIYLGYWPFLLLGIWSVLQFNPSKLTEQSLISSIFLTESSMFVLIVGIAWSLVYELYFYVVFSCSTWIKKGYRLFVLLFLAIFVLSWNSYWQIAHPVLVINGGMPGKFIFGALALEFLGGCLLAYGYNFVLRLPTIKIWIFYLVAILIAVMLLFAAITEPKIRFNDLYRALYFGGFAAITIICVVTSEQRFVIRYPKWLVKIGDSSFTLYLFHGFALNFALSGGIYEFLRLHQSLINLYWILFVTAVLTISYVYYKNIEYPLYKAFTKFLQAIGIFRPNVFKN